MKKARYLATTLAALTPIAGAAACTPAETGELIVVVQTDMDLPKDVDTVRIEVTVAGIPRYDQAHTRLGTKDGILLPATLGLLVPEDPRDPATIRVSARQGGGPDGRGGVVRALNQVVTTIPEDQVATLHVPIHFLCDGSGNDDGSGTGHAENACPDGQTCRAGTCVPQEVEPASTPEYLPADVFGGGTGKRDGVCLDVAVCLEGATAVKVTRDGDRCAIEGDAIEGDVNIALLTEVDGMCGVDGCYVVLDAGSEAGWTRDMASGSVLLPTAVCERLGDRVKSVMAAPVSAGCPQKRVRTPTCGPWSAVGERAALDDATPIARVSGQDHPLSIALSDDALFWTSSGLFEQVGAALEQKTKGTVRSAKQGTADPSEARYSGDALPRDIVIDNSNTLVWTVASTASDGERSIMRLDLSDPMAEPKAAPFAVKNPEGLAFNSTSLFWTEFTEGTIQRATSDVASPIAAPGPNSHPVRIVADDSLVCWTNEGTQGMGNGSVQCVPLAPSVGAPVLIKDKLETPRAIALTPTGLFWATFNEQGTIYAAPRDKASGALAADKLTVLTSEPQNFPNGIAADEETLYWTNRGDGTVWKLALTPSGSAPTKIASGQKKPGEIAIGKTDIYWINEGLVVTTSSTAPGAGLLLAGDGAVIRVKK